MIEFVITLFLHFSLDDYMKNVTKAREKQWENLFSKFEAPVSIKCDTFYIKNFIQNYNSLNFKILRYL